MTLVLLGNYAQTGHFGGPLAYTPFNVAAHLVGPERGGLRYDYRRPKHPFGDKFMMAAGHSVPTCYALYMVLGQALERNFKLTGDKRYAVDPEVAMLPIDALGFRRGAGALKTLLQENGLADDPLFAQAKARGIKALSGHAESIDVTNDVNGGPSGVGVATAAGKAAFWDMVGAADAPKIIALEGEFAMTEGPCPGTQDPGLGAAGGQAAARHPVGQQCRHRRCAAGRRHSQEIHRLQSGRAVDVLWLERPSRSRTAAITARSFRTLAAMEGWDSGDKRPMIVIAKTTKGYWPAASNGNLSDTVKQIVSYQSHPYGHKMNSDYFVALAEHLREALRHDSSRASATARSPTPRRAPDPVQDQYRQGDVGARPERAGRLAGRPAGGDRRHGQGRPQDRHRQQDRSLPGRTAAGREPAAGAAKADGQEPHRRRDQGSLGGAVPQGRAKSWARAAPFPKSSNG